MGRNFNYGGRTGMWSIIFFVHQVCRIYGIFMPSILAFITASSLTTEQKDTVTAWLNGATEACSILELLFVSYE